MKGLNRFSQEICIPKARLKAVAENITKYYREKQIIKELDDGTPRLLPNGEYEYRDICESRGVLKEIQQRVKKLYLDNIDWPKHVHGGIKGHSNISNAKAHQGKRYHFLTDVRKFFPSIHFEKVHDVFLGLGLSHDVAHLATKFTTLDFCLPQGTPTSTHLANLVFLETDRKILSLIANKPIVYTRFIDDLVFSSHEDFRHLTCDILWTIQQDGYRIKYRKRSDSKTEQITFYKIGPAEITGVIANNNDLEAPQKLYDKLDRLDKDSLNFIGLENYITRIENT